ncbi:RNA-binding protein 4.1-like isoform X1 [Hypomesus transpacificus]|uniref:RNA-binding protein 4.1-like isoform X1 n=1 Tax=Hypomesus transpacificus TaxID=137520 RepID=UPI001F085647|nr:RNA-binding protein 4.1-like isoform X1 [Hypomesus transpacificus]XP_046905324.1 RNA-binding protein 4.1-like isoform X1 [Hypomesus transpacificus]
MVKIFVGNLATSTTEEELRSLFTQYGKISECDILKNYGFVHMSSQTEAEEAIRNLHHYELNGEAMNVEMSKRRPKSTTKLHVSNIPEDCSSVDLKAKFEEYGPVVECDIVKDYAFVHMECVDDAMEAISKLDNTAFQGKLMSVQLSTSRLRTAPGMGDQTGCFVCGKQGHWSKDCPSGQNGSYDDGLGGGPMRGRGRGRGFPPRGPPGYGRGGGYGMPRPPPSDYMLAYSREAGYLGGIPPPPPMSRRPSYGASREYSDLRERYGSRPASAYPERAVYERERYSSVDYYEKYRARPYGSSYFEERRLAYIPPPPPPSSSLSRLSSGLDLYERRPLPPPATAAAAAASYYARDRSPIRRVPVTSAGFAYERSRLSPMSATRSSSYAIARARDPYAERSRYAY